MTCEYEDFMKAIEICDLKIKNQYLDYIISKTYEDSNDTNIIYYESMFNKFSGTYKKKNKKEEPVIESKRQSILTQLNTYL